MAISEDKQTTKEQGNLLEMAPKELNFITGNANKLAEVKAILADSGVELRSQSVDLVEIQGTVEEVTKDKCRRAAEHVRAIPAFPKRKQ